MFPEIDGGGLGLPDAGIGDAGQADKRAIFRTECDITVGLGHDGGLAGDGISDNAEAVLGADDEREEAVEIADRAFERFADPERLIDGLGAEYEIMNTAIKRWAVGYPIQAPLDAVANLIAQHGVSARDVAQVVVTIDEQGARTVNARKMADINIQHLVAMMLVDGEITFASSHHEARLRDPRIAAFRKRITLQGSAALSRTRTTQAIVEITTRTGEKLRHHTKHVRGTPTNPMPRPEVETKSRDLLVPVIGRGRAEGLIAAVSNIDKLADVRALRPLLRASR